MADPFESILGASHVRVPEGETLDGVPISAVLRPGSAAEVAACLAAAAEHGLAVVPCGGGTALARANPPRATSVVRLELGRLREPLQVQPDEGIAIFAAGLPVAEAERSAQAAGMRTWLPHGAAGSSVGGAIAADPLRADASLDRGLRNDLLGLEVALANGSVTRCGGRVVKNVTGFDLVRLYCGSFGTLGVITSAILRVRPLPETVRVLVRECPDADAALDAAAELDLARVEPAGCVVLCASGGARLVWRLEGSALEVEARASRASGTRVDPTEWDAAEAALRPEPAGDELRVRLAARPSDTRALVRALAAWAVPQARLVALPIAGTVLADLPESALPELYAVAGRERWLLALERAAPEVRARHDAFGPAPDALSVMRALKQRFDPDGVLSPGRFVARI